MPSRHFTRETIIHSPPAAHSSPLLHSLLTLALGTRGQQPQTPAAGAAVSSKAPNTRRKKEEKKRVLACLYGKSCRDEETRTANLLARGRLLTSTAEDRAVAMAASDAVLSNRSTEGEQQDEVVMEKLGSDAVGFCWRSLTGWRQIYPCPSLPHLSPHPYPSEAQAVLPTQPFPGASCNYSRQPPVHSPPGFLSLP